MGVAEGLKMRTAVVDAADAWHTADGAIEGAVTGSGNEFALIGATVGEVARLFGIVGIIPTAISFTIAIYGA
jgi:hypothetical protein